MNLVAPLAPNHSPLPMHVVNQSLPYKFLESTPVVESGSNHVCRWNYQNRWSFDDHCITIISAYIFCQKQCSQPLMP